MFGHLPGLPHINNEGFYDVVLEKRGGNCPPSPPLPTPLMCVYMHHNDSVSPHKEATVGQKVSTSQPHAVVKVVIEVGMTRTTAALIFVLIMATKCA